MVGKADFQEKEALKIGEVWLGRGVLSPLEGSRPPEGRDYYACLLTALCSYLYCSSSPFLVNCKHFQSFQSRQRYKKCDEQSLILRARWGVQVPSGHGILDMAPNLSELQFCHLKKWHNNHCSACYQGLSWYLKVTKQ